MWRSVYAGAYLQATPQLVSFRKSSKMCGRFFSVVFQSLVHGIFHFINLWFIGCVIVFSSFFSFFLEPFHCSDSFLLLIWALFKSLIRGARHGVIRWFWAQFAIWASSKPVRLRLHFCRPTHLRSGFPQKIECPQLWRAHSQLSIFYFSSFLILSSLSPIAGRRFRPLYAGHF